jgi:hypothetical protein
MGAGSKEGYESPVNSVSLLRLIKPSRPLVSFVDETPAVAEFYKTDSRMDCDTDDMNVIEKLLELPLQHDDYHSEPDLIDSRTSTCQYDPIIQSIEVRSDRSSTSLSLPNGLSLGPLRKPSFSGGDLVHLSMDDDVETDIRMLWASEGGPRQNRKSMSTPIRDDASPYKLTAQEAFLLQLFRNKLGTWVSVASLLF